MFWGSSKYERDFARARQNGLAHSSQLDYFANAEAMRTFLGSVAVIGGIWLAIDPYFDGIYVMHPYSNELLGAAFGFVGTALAATSFSRGVMISNAKAAKMKSEGSNKKGKKGKEVPANDNQVTMPIFIDDRKAA